jgi:hypothetical protein
MKINYLILLVFLAGCAVTSTAPFELSYREGYLLECGERSIILGPGEVIDVKLRIHRAMGFHNKPIELSVTNLPESVDATFEPNPVRGDTAVMRLTSIADHSVGRSLLIVSGNSYPYMLGWPKKGIIIQLDTNPAFTKSK